MGMAASQARFLGLTARQNNVEFEGQQINQQRTMLANQSANYYNDLLGMSVPTPPSVDKYTQTMYTFNDGSLTNTVTAMIAQSNGLYTLSYLSKWQDDYTPISAATSVVTRSAAGIYSVGPTDLRKLGEGIELIPPKAGDTLPNKSGKWDGHHVYQDADGLYVKPNQLTKKEDIDNIGYFYFADDISNEENWEYIDDVPYYKDADGNLHPALYEATKEGSSFFYEDENGEKQQVSLDRLTMCMDLEKAGSADQIVFVELDEEGKYLREPKDGEETKHYLTEQELTDYSGLSFGRSAALDGMTEAEIKGLLKEEAAWLQLLEQKYQESDWYVRYQLDTTSGKKVPYFYSKESLDNADFDAKGNTLSAIRCYTIGSEQKVEEFKGIQDCKIEKDSSGRLINISIPKTTSTGATVYETFALTTQTSTDQDAYNNAMNQYEYDKALYDQAVEKINSKIEILQAEDKNLELRLKQLDTEQKAISNEKEAVQKVIEKNTSDTFKTFNA